MEVFAVGEDTLVCRLQASLVSLRLGHARGKTTHRVVFLHSRAACATICGRDMQHTALCGILPGEQMLVRQIKSGTNRTKQTASDNTPFARSASGVESDTPGKKRRTTARAGDVEVLPYGKIFALAVYERARHLCVQYANSFVLSHE